jgi:hypothetical protein
MLARAKAWLAEQTTDDLAAVADTSKRVAAVASAARRVSVASQVELDYAEAAREAERRLGQLLDEGRAEGTVARQRQGTGDGLRVDHLGLSSQLAADAAAFAKLPDDHWREIIESCRKQETMVRRALRGAVKERLAQLASIEDREREQIREAERLAEERQAILDEITEAAKQPLSKPVVEADLSVSISDATPEQVTGIRSGSDVDDLATIRDYVRDLAGVRRTLESLAKTFPDVQTEADGGFHLACRSALSAVVTLAHEIGARVNEREQRPKIRRVQ